MTMIIRLILFAVILALFAGCEDSSSSFTYERRVVINGLIESGRSVDTISISFTGAVDKPYSLSDYAITTAVVTISGVDSPFRDSLHHDPARPGRYYSVDTTKKILPAKSYRMDVHVPGGGSYSAVTTVPDTFSLIYSTLGNNSVVKYNTGLPVNYFVWSTSRFHGTYLPTITSTDSNAARIPKSFIQDTTEFRAPDKVGYRVGLPKEQNYTELPWIFINYYGTTLIDVYAIDENYTQFLNQYVTTQGGELKEIRYSIPGAIGFFGSRTKASGGIKIYLTP